MSDTSWSPPPAPEDLDPHRLVDGFALSGWPSWVTGTGGFEIGSRWRLTEAARVVVPAHSPGPTLALEDGFPVAERYYEGWATRTYRIDTGQCAGVLATFSADKRGNRFPFSSRQAHASIVPEDGLPNRP